MANKKPKFPLCSKYGLFVPIESVERKDYLTYKKVELALSKAEEQGKLEAFLAKKTLEKNELDTVHKKLYELFDSYSKKRGSPDWAEVQGIILESKERLKSQLSKEGAKK